MVSSIRKELATLLFYAKLQKNVASMAIGLCPYSRDELLGDLLHEVFDISFWETASTRKELWQVLYLISVEEKNLPLSYTVDVLKRLIQKEEISDEDHVFSGDIKNLVITVKNPISKWEKAPLPITVKLLTEGESFSFYPFSNWFSFQVDNKRKEEITRACSSFFQYCNDSIKSDNCDWIVRIMDSNDEIFEFYGEGKTFSEFPRLSIPRIPYMLGVKDLAEKDEVSILSFNYTRLSRDNKKEILESLLIDRTRGTISLSYQSNDEEMSMEKKNEFQTLDEIFKDVSFYDLYPAIMNEPVSPMITVDEGYTFTRYSLSITSKNGRTASYLSFFTSIDLPQNWLILAKSLRKHYLLATAMESFEPSLIKLPRTDEDSVFVCSVEFSPSSHLYSYIAPDDSFRPGDKVLVGVGMNNKLQVVKIKELKVLSKKNDKEKLKGLKKVISHYPNNNTK